MTGCCTEYVFGREKNEHVFPAECLGHCLLVSVPSHSFLHSDGFKLSLTYELRSYNAKKMTRPASIVN